MDFNWSILGWIAGLVFVYLFGLFEGRNQGYKKRKAEEGQEKKDLPPPPTAKSETVTVDDPGLLRIKNENGSFVLDLDGRRVNPISLSSDQRKRLIDMLSVLRPWLEGRSVPASAPAIKPSAPPPPAQPVTLDERLNAIGSQAPRSEPAPQPQPPAARQTAQPPAPISRPSAIAKEDRPVAPANSIVSQIDAILQEVMA